MQNHFKDEFVNVDNTNDIDESIIIDSIKEGIFKLEVEEEKGLLTNLEVGSLIELEESLKGLTANVLLNNNKEAFDRCEELEPDK